MRYVARDAELTMMLAYDNDCLALEIMKYIALYSEMDYYRCCHTGVSQWYANIYKNMIKRRNVSLNIPKTKRYLNYTLRAEIVFNLKRDFTKINLLMN